MTVTDPTPDYGDPSEWDDEWPEGIPARIADELRALGWNVTGWSDGAFEIALPPYHETGVWLGGGGRLWTGLLESDSTCRNPVQVTANPSDPGEIAANADPLLKEIAKNAERMAAAIAVGVIGAFLEALAADPQPWGDPAYPAGIAGPDGMIHLTEYALRTLHTKYWDYRTRLREAVAERDALRRELGVITSRPDVRQLVASLQRLVTRPVTVADASSAMVVTTIRHLVGQIALGLGVGGQAPQGASQGHAERPGPGSGQLETEHAHPGPQRAAGDVGAPRASDVGVFEQLTDAPGAIATADVHAQIAADKRTPPTCAGCDLPETNCACG